MHGPVNSVRILMPFEPSLSINGGAVGNSDCKPAGRANGMAGGFWAYTPKAAKVNKSTDPKTAQIKKITSTSQKEVRAVEIIFS